MPTVPGIPGPYRFFFYSFDCNEPKHVHVRRARRSANPYLEPVALAYNNGFSAKELNRIRKIVLDEPIKRVGEYTVTIKLHADVTADFKLSVVAEEQASA